MTKPYLLLSDIHAHAWSQFAAINPDGVNSRLQIILDEIKRGADTLIAAGGNTIRLAGDLFHTRGSVDPEVFNPVSTLVKGLQKDGFVFEAIPGNHDLKGKHTSELGNAFQSFADAFRFDIVTKPLMVDDDTIMVPWQATVADLRRVIADIRTAHASYGLSKVDLIMHAGIDGVLPGMPDHGISSSEVVDWGFRRVFSGHYHNHKMLEGGKVISIGATTHQTWGDVNTNAGFLLVWPDRVKFYASHAPNFVDVDESVSADDLPLLVDGNYVRIRGMRMSSAQINDMRIELMDLGAKGVSFQVTRETVNVRSSVVTKAVSIDASIHNYIESLSDPNEAAIKTECHDILSAVRSVTI